MILDFRKLALGVAVIGLGLGVAFGAGIAYGRGDPKTVESGLSAQQLQSLLGTDVLQSATAGAGAAPDAGVVPGGAAGLLGASPTGVVTAISEASITIETLQGSQTIQLESDTLLNLLSQAEVGSLEEGQTVIISGSENNEGVFVAAAISEVPEGLGFVAGAGGAPAGGRDGGGRTP